MHAIPSEALPDTADSHDLPGGVFHSHFVADGDRRAVDDQVAGICCANRDKMRAASGCGVHTKMACGSACGFWIQARHRPPGIVARLRLDQGAAVAECLRGLEQVTVGIIFQVFVGERRIDVHSMLFVIVVVEAQHHTVADAAAQTVAAHGEHIAAVVIAVVRRIRWPGAAHVLNMIGTACCRGFAQGHLPFDIFREAVPVPVFPEYHGAAFRSHQKRITHIFLVGKDGVVIAFRMQFET